MSAEKLGPDARRNADLARRARAEELLGNELLQEAFAALEARYLEEWRVTQFRDTDARERLWQAVNVLGKVKEHLGRVAADGKLAQRQLDDMIRQENRSERR